MPDTSLSSGARKLMIWPKDSDLAPIKQAVLDLKLPYRVQPFWWSPDINDGTRVLVLADGFEYSTITDRIYPKNPSVLPDAILWCLEEKELDRGPSYWVDVMESYGLKLVDVFSLTGEGLEEDEPW